MTHSQKPGITIAGRSVANLAGLLVPSLVALVSLPILNDYLGTSRVGFLALAWALIGYVGLFDFGIGRALTVLVAERIGQGDRRGAARLVWFATGILALIGSVVGVCLAMAAPWIVSTAMGVSGPLREESRLALGLLAGTVPFVIVAAAFRGVLEAQGRFWESSAIRAPLGIWLVGSPLLLIPLGVRSLLYVAGVLAVGRVIGCAAYAVSAVRGLPELTSAPSYQHGDMLGILRLGGWITVSNVVSPLMSYLDRFLVSAMLGLSSVAYYSIPWELVTKVLIVPGSLAAVLFPVFAGYGLDGGEQKQALLMRGMAVLALVMLPAMLAVNLFSAEALVWWIGSDFSAQASPVLKWLSLGVLLNSIATIPYAFIQASKRPDVTARVHLLELPVYAAGVFALTGSFGIAGTAAAWTIRVGVDLVALWLLSVRKLQATCLMWRMLLPLAGIGVLFSVAATLHGWIAKGLLLASIVACEVALVAKSNYWGRERAAIAKTFRGLLDWLSWR